MAAAPLPSEEKENKQQLMDSLDALEKSLLEEIPSIEEIKSLREKILTLAAKIFDPTIVPLIQPLIMDIENYEKKFTVVDQQKVCDDLLKVQNYLKRQKVL